MTALRSNAVPKWACPRCGAGANECGKEIAHLHTGEPCNDERCNGFLCECDWDTSEEHGQTLSDRCANANCYHCGWVEAILDAVDEKMRGR